MARDSSSISCVTGCESDLMQAADFGAACVAAVNNRAGCLGGLTCVEYQAWRDETPADDYPCMAEDTAIDECAN